MSRPERLVIAGVAMHVRQRGVNRADCFREETDRLVYLSCLRDLLATTGCALHAYCLMTNHVHLLLTPRDDVGCATLMRDLGRRYVPYFNRRHGRTGTLWEGRFRSCLVDSARYVLGCYRYIELNAVEAGMVASPNAYRWSSYAGNAGLAEDNLLTPHIEYEALASAPEARRCAYRGLFNSPNDAELVKALRDATFGGYALVGDQLKSRLVATGGRVEREKPGPKRKPREEGELLSADLFNE
jgi:putative transposase